MQETQNYHKAGGVQEQEQVMQQQNNSIYILFISATWDSPHMQERLLCWFLLQVIH